jgi:hypothetical protein
MHEDLGPRLLEYLRAALQCPRVDYAEPLVPVSGGFDTEIFAFRLNGAVPASAEPSSSWSGAPAGRCSPPGV